MDTAFNGYEIYGTMDDWDARAVTDLYTGIDAERIVTDSRTAALLKYACNAFHALKVVFANEIGALAKSFGADGQQAMKLRPIVGKAIFLRDTVERHKTAGGSPPPRCSWSSRSCEFSGS